MPETRFRKTFVNHRYNPFTDSDMAIDISENGLYIPSSTPYHIQLKEQPKKTTPSTVSVYNVSEQIQMVEVMGTPSAGQFRVDYPPPDGKGTGQIEFSSADAGREVNISYMGTGSVVITQFLDWAMFYPPGVQNGDMFFWNNNDIQRLPKGSDGQTIKYASGIPVATNFPIRIRNYFHEGLTVYNSAGEDESCTLLRFKNYTGEAIKLELKGAKLKQYLYSELTQHSHSVDTYTNTAGAHTHGAGTLAGTQPAHQHEYWHGERDLILTYPAGNDPVTITGETASAGSHYHWFHGSTGNAGVIAKTFPNQLKVYIDGVNRTSIILTRAGLDKLGDGTGTHAFVSNGTGEIDITDLVSGSGFHEIKITEPISGAGGTVFIHLELTYQP